MCLCPLHFIGRHRGGLGVVLVVPGHTLGLRLDLGLWIGQGVGVGYGPSSSYLVSGEARARSRGWGRVRVVLVVPLLLPSAVDATHICGVVSRRERVAW